MTLQSTKSLNIVITVTLSVPSSFVLKVQIATKERNSNFLSFLFKKKLKTKEDKKKTPKKLTRHF